MKFQVCSSYCEQILNTIVINVYNVISDIRLLKKDITSKQKEDMAMLLGNVNAILENVKIIKSKEKHCQDKNIKKMFYENQKRDQRKEIQKG